MKFDAKTFNAETFAFYANRFPEEHKNEMIKSGVLKNDARLMNLFSSQTGSHFGTIPFYGNIGGDAQNFDGDTDITTTGSDTFEQSCICFNRMKGWKETDFSSIVTAGGDFTDNDIKQIPYYKDCQNTKALLSILEGIFSMTGEANLAFVNNHTYDITGEVDAQVSATTLNNAIQKASGDKSGNFKMAIMHSAVATGLQNLNLVEYLKYTDAQGVQRSLQMATWNGRSVIIDDGMPVSADGKYTTYLFGTGAFLNADIPLKDSFEMVRNAFERGGTTSLITRWRKSFMPYGISYTKKSQAKVSPTNAELAMGANWALVNNGLEGDAFKTVNHKDIPIARIISLVD